jgi:DNA-binding GntR family transcriptional regulator
VGGVSGQAPRPARRMTISPPRVRSMSDQVTESLRSMILVGDLRSGDQVTQEKLAEDLGVSTMPVREALLRLAHEGFVQGGRGRSFRIAPTTREDIQDIYWVHATLAGELNARACERMSRQDLEQLSQIHERWLAAVAAGNVSGLERENFEFHRLINHAAQSPKLLMLLRNTLRLIPEHFYTLLQDWATTSTRDHERILRALRKGDAEAVRKVSSNHVQQAGKMLIEYFNEQGFWDNPNGKR